MARLLGAEHRRGWIEEIRHGAAFAEELRIVANREVHPRALPAGTLERRDYHGSRRTRQQRAPQHDGVMRTFKRQSLPDLAAYVLDVSQVEFAVRSGGRPDTGKGDVGLADGRTRIRGGGEPRGPSALGHQVVHARLDDRTATRSEHLDFGGVDIHSGHAVALLGYAGRRNPADLSPAQHAVLSC